ncbi:MAG: S8 family serine peptidase [Xanthobacteraceae bacterium]
MRKSAMSLRPIPALLLGGLLVTACCIAGSHPAAAFGMGGFGGRPMMGGPMMGPRPGAGMVGPRPGGGMPVGRPPGMGGWPARHPPFVGGGGGGGGYVGNGGPVGPGNGGGNRNNGGGGAPQQGNQNFVPNEVITAFAPGATPQAIGLIARQYELTQLDSQSFPLLGTSLYRWRLGGGRTVANTVRALGGERIVASVQPNYVFTLQEETAKIAAGPHGDAAQYVLAKLQSEQAQQIATGKDVLVAVIDSEIDAKHPDLDRTVVKSFDALGGSEKPHAHGTSIAGAIAAHGKLLGIAPGAQVLAIHAFDDNPGAAHGSSFAIYRGLQWAADNGARVVNMSFAGPADPALQRMLAAAYDKGIVLIAAAGNAGPKSDPLYPAANPNVIAVTATDSDDHLFPMANRGRHIAVAAPGVDIFTLAPGDGYVFTTGTSIAAAHVSGIVALLLEHKPSLTPGDIRAALTATAQPLGPPRPDSDFGAGLVSAYRAVLWLDRSPAAPADGGAQAKQ